ncbi:GNAT family N-acetyltransferase [Treponema parvum]|uniref:GNAT family N-acetyltransferase n=1 Tax=Treponema parvum TaxID=138851 RepID=A0A975IDS0_9SPIR|nr:GNAT family N-acetyltransferase [Treponema parvum]QTQ13107.1 GNAT family N-acetyltransferase [Treponema parvum]
MNFIPVDREDKAIHDFLKKHEPFCVALIQSLKKKETSVYALYNRIKGEIKGVIALSGGNMLMHYIPKEFQTDLLKNDVAAVLKKHSVSGINGEAVGSAYLISALEKINNVKYKIKNSYRLMELKNNGFCESEKKICQAFLDVEIRRCTQADVLNLLPLETAYQEEEVLPFGRKADPVICRYMLSGRMKEQYIFAAFTKDGSAVAKAATSSLSWEWAQLGGIYTVPEYRRKGLAFAVLKSLISFLFSNQKNCVLFVKDKNTNAYELYKKCGFKEIAAYTIAYYSDVV